MHSYRCLMFSLFSLICGLHILFSQTDEKLVKGTIIVVNRNAPESLEIAQYYAQQRGIPESNIVHLYAPTEETTTVKEYVETLANPLLEALPPTHLSLPASSSPSVFRVCVSRCLCVGGSAVVCACGRAREVSRARR